MERVTFDRPLTPTELAQLTEFMALHPELAGLHVALNFKGIQDNTKLPFGTVAEFDRKTQVPLSFLPANMSHVNALFEIDEPFSELAFLRNDRLQEQTKAFQKALKAEGIGTTCFKDNFWHYVPNWEHFLARSTAQTKSPFTDARNRKATYSRKAIPHAEDLLGRTLIMGISVKMPSARMKVIRQAIANAAKVL